MLAQADILRQLRPSIPPAVNRNTAITGPRVSNQIELRPFTVAQTDTRLFGEHTGIQLRGPIVDSPIPTQLSNVPTWLTTLKGNAWYLAPGWTPFRRVIDTRWRGSGHVPKLRVNPWDFHYGHIGQYGSPGQPPSPAEVIRVNQMGTMSFV